RLLRGLRAAQPKRLEEAGDDTTETAARRAATGRSGDEARFPRAAVPRALVTVSEQLVVLPRRAGLALRAAVLVTGACGIAGARVARLLALALVLGLMLGH